MRNYLLLYKQVLSLKTSLYEVVTFLKGLRCYLTQ